MSDKVQWYTVPHCKCPADIRGWGERFMNEIYTMGADIDATDDLDWFSLTVGWALALGVKPEEAYEVASHVRYHLQEK